MRVLFLRPLPSPPVLLCDALPIELPSRRINAIPPAIVGASPGGLLDASPWGRRCIGSRCRRGGGLLSALSSLPPSLLAFSRHLCKRTLAPSEYVVEYNFTSIDRLLLCTLSATHTLHNELLQLTTSRKRKSKGSRRQTIYRRESPSLLIIVCWLFALPMAAGA